jgi:hypothetical protein
VCSHRRHQRLLLPAMPPALLQLPRDAAERPAAVGQALAAERRQLQRGSVQQQRRPAGAAAAAAAAATRTLAASEARASASASGGSRRGRRHLVCQCRGSHAQLCHRPQAVADRLRGRAPGPLLLLVARALLPQLLLIPRARQQRTAALQPRRHPGRRGPQPQARCRPRSVADVLRLSSRQRCCAGRPKGRLPRRAGPQLQQRCGVQRVGERLRPKARQLRASSIQQLVRQDGRHARRRLPQLLLLLL